MARHREARTGIAVLAFIVAAAAGQYYSPSDVRGDCVDKEDGQYAVNHCSPFFNLCSGGATYRQNCADGLSFNPASSQCDFPSNIEACQESFSCIGRPDGHYGEGCSSIYWACVGGTLEKEICGSNLFFDSEQQQCTYREQVRACGGVTPSTAPPRSRSSRLTTAISTDAPTTTTAAPAVDEQPTPAADTTGAAPYGQTYPTYAPRLRISGTVEKTPLSESSAGTGCAGKDDGSAPAGDCSPQYFLCWSGTGTKATCPSELVFNPSNGQCDYAANVVSCGGASAAAAAAAPAASTAYGTAVPARDSYRQTTVVSADAPISLPIPRQPAAFDCSNRSDGLFSLSSTCTRDYIQCSNGVGVERECPAGLVYNEAATQCDYVENCGKTPAPPMAADAPTTTTTSAYSGSAKIDFDCSTRVDGLYSRGCIADFIQCAAGVTYQQKCGGGLVFDDFTKACDYPEICSAPHTTPAPTAAAAEAAAYSRPAAPAAAPPAVVSFDCSTRADGVYADGCVVEYFSCVSGVAYAARCPAGTVFDGVKQACDYPDNCGQPRPLEHDNLAAGYEATPSTAAYQKQQPAAAAPAEFDCSSRSDGFYSPSPCSASFFQCVAGSAYTQLCPSSLVFEERSGACDYPERCSGKQDAPVAVPVVTVAQPAAPAASPTLAPAGIDCFEKTDGLYGSTCARSFVQCTNGFALNQICPEGLVFVQESSRCDYPTNCETAAAAAPPSAAYTPSLPSTVPYAPAAAVATAAPVASDIPTGVLIDCATLADGLYSSGCTHAFVQCANGGAYPLECAAGLVFDKTSASCVWPDECGAAAVAAAPTTGYTPSLPVVPLPTPTTRPASDVPTTVFDMDYQRKKSVPEVAKDGSLCTGTGRRAMGKCSSGFVQCIGGKLIARRCPGQSLFDEKIGLCVYDLEGCEMDVDVVDEEEPTVSGVAQDVSRPTYNPQQQQPQPAQAAPLYNNNNVQPVQQAPPTASPYQQYQNGYATVAAQEPNAYQSAYNYQQPQPQQQYSPAAGYTQQQQQQTGYGSPYDAVPAYAPSYSSFDDSSLLSHSSPSSSPQCSIGSFRRVSACSASYDTCSPTARQWIRQVCGKSHRFDSATNQCRPIFEVRECDEPLSSYVPPAAVQQSVVYGGGAAAAPAYAADAASTSFHAAAPVNGKDYHESHVRDYFKGGVQSGRMSSNPFLAVGNTGSFFAEDGFRWIGSSWADNGVAPRRRQQRVGRRFNSHHGKFVLVSGNPFGAGRYGRVLNDEWRGRRDWNDGPVRSSLAKGGRVRGRVADEFKGHVDHFAPPLRAVNPFAVKRGDGHRRRRKNCGRRRHHSRRRHDWEDDEDCEEEEDDDDEDEPTNTTKTPATSGTVATTINQSAAAKERDEVELPPAEEEEDEDELPSNADVSAESDSGVEEDEDDEEEETEKIEAVTEEGEEEKVEEKAEEDEQPSAAAAASIDDEDEETTEETDAADLPSESAAEEDEREETGEIVEAEPYEPVENVEKEESKPAETDPSVPAEEEEKEAADEEESEVKVDEEEDDEEEKAQPEEVDPSLPAEDAAEEEEEEAEVTASSADEKTVEKTSEEPAPAVADEEEEEEEDEVPTTGAAAAAEPSVEPEYEEGDDKADLNALPEEDEDEKIEAASEEPAADDDEEEEKEEEETPSASAAPATEIAEDGVPDEEDTPVEGEAALKTPADEELDEEKEEKAETETDAPAADEDEDEDEETEKTEAADVGEPSSIDDDEEDEEKTGGAETPAESSSAASAEVAADDDEEEEKAEVTTTDGVKVEEKEVGAAESGQEFAEKDGQTVADNEIVNADEEEGHGLDEDQADHEFKHDTEHEPEEEAGAANGEEAPAAAAADADQPESVEEDDDEETIPEGQVLPEDDDEEEKEVSVETKNVAEAGEEKDPSHPDGIDDDEEEQQEDEVVNEAPTRKKRSVGYNGPAPAASTVQRSPTRRLSLPRSSRLHRSRFSRLCTSKAATQTISIGQCRQDFIYCKSARRPVVAACPVGDLFDAVASTCVPTEICGAEMTNLEFPTEAPAVVGPSSDAISSTREEGYRPSLPLSSPTSTASTYTQKIDVVAADVSSDSCSGRSDGAYSVAPCSSTYFVCASSVFNKYNCPSNLAYDEKSDSCQWPDLMPACGGAAASPTSAPSSAAYTTSSFVRDETSAPTAIHTGFKCSQDGGFAIDCKGGFVMCSGGVASLMKCPASLTFDETTQACLYPAQVLSCGIAPLSPSADSSSSSAEYVRSPLPSTAFPSTTTTTASPARAAEYLVNTPVADKAVCTGVDSNLVPVSGPCSSAFVICKEGQVQATMNCPAGLFFHQKSGKCDYREIACGAESAVVADVIHGGWTGHAHGIEATVVAESSTEPMVRQSRPYRPSMPLAVEKMEIELKEEEKIGRDEEKRGGEAYRPVIVPSTVEAAKDATCDWEGVAPAGVCSTKFIICSNGKPEVFDCTASTVFDDSTKSCGYPEFVRGCPQFSESAGRGDAYVPTLPSATTTPASAPAESYETAADQEEPSTIDQSDATYERDSVPSTTTVRPLSPVAADPIKFEATGDHCIYDAKFPAYPLNYCSRTYAVCTTEGKAYETNCTFGFLFDSAIRRCVLSEHCGEDYLKKMADLPIPTVSAHNPSDWTGDARCAGLADGTLKASALCSNNYLRCDKESVIIESCSGSAEVFSSLTGRCVLRVQMAECATSRPGTVPAITRPKPTEAASADVHKPWFSASTPAADFSSVPSSSYPAAPPSHRGSRIRGGLSGSDASQSAHFDARSFCSTKNGDGLYRNPEDCAGIVQCFGGEAFSYPSCAPGLFFNELDGQCDYASNVEGCAAQADPIAVTDSSTSCKGQPHGAHLADDENCSIYYRCVWGRLERLDCPKGTVFNPRLSICDYPSEVPHCSNVQL